MRKRDTPARAGTAPAHCPAHPPSATGASQYLAAVGQPQRRHWARWSATAALRLRREPVDCGGDPAGSARAGNQRCVRPVARVLGAFPRRRRPLPRRQRHGSKRGDRSCLRRCSERSPPGRSRHSPAAHEHSSDWPVLQAEARSRRRFSFVRDMPSANSPKSAESSPDRRHPASCRWATVVGARNERAGCREPKQNQTESTGRFGCRSALIVRPSTSKHGSRCWRKPVGNRCHRYDHRLVGCLCAGSGRCLCAASGDVACAM